MLQYEDQAIAGQSDCEALGGGGEDEGFDAGAAHGGEQLQGAVDVVVVILQRFFHGFAS